MTIPTLMNAYLCVVMLQEIAAFSLIVASFPHWITLSISSKSTLVRLLSAHRRAAHLFALVCFLQAFSTPDIGEPRQFHVYNRLFFSGFTLLLAYLGTRIEAEKYCELYLTKKRMLDAIHVSETEKYDTSTKDVEQELVHMDQALKTAQFGQEEHDQKGEAAELPLVSHAVGTTFTDKADTIDRALECKEEMDDTGMMAVVD